MVLIEVHVSVVHRNGLMASRRHCSFDRDSHLGPACLCCVAEVLKAKISDASVGHGLFKNLPQSVNGNRLPVVRENQIPHVGDPFTFLRYFLQNRFQTERYRNDCLNPSPTDTQIEVLHGEEGEILRDFWKLAAGSDLFVGHNVLDFDLRFIYQRSVIKQIKPSRDISFSRFRNSPVFDTMHEWTRWGRDLIKLDTLAKSLNIPSPKTDLDGSKVYDYYKAGKEPEIYEYCKGDVETVRKVYRRMSFSE